MKAARNTASEARVISVNIGISLAGDAPQRTVDRPMRESNPQALSSKSLRHNDLKNGAYYQSVDKSQSSTANAGKHTLADSDSPRLAPSLQFIAERWPILPPHLREALIAFVDCASIQQSLKEVGNE
jgi:hypothetical protein